MIDSQCMADQAVNQVDMLQHAVQDCSFTLQPGLA